MSKRLATLLASLACVLAVTAGCLSPTEPQSGTDTFSSQRVCDQPIPFDLATTGVVALDERNWNRQSNVEFQGHMMLGLPVEFTSERISESGAARVEPTMFGVRRLATHPDDVEQTRYPRFVGQIDHELPLRSVEGMSGGPIFGFNFDTSAYWIVALQNSWLPRRRIVFGCPVPLFASMLTEWASRETVDP